MTYWLTAEEIGERYVVGPERLQAYASRGNLACRRPEGGPMLFDEDAVARLFRPRHGGIVVTKNGTQRESLGILGVVKLGDAPGRSGSNPVYAESRRHRRITNSDVVPTFPGALEMDVVIPRARKRG